MSDPRWPPPGDATPPEGDPPPPPPPPEARVPDDGAPTYGAGDWQPPTRRRRTGLVVGIVVAIVAIPLVLGGIALVAVREVGPEAADGGGAATTAPRPAPPPDDAAGQGEAILQAIDGSEERMIAFQQEAFDAIGQDGTVGDAAEEVSQAAQEAGNDLTELRTRLRNMAEGGQGDTFEALRDVRDGYAEHMTAWIEYLDAVVGQPALAGPRAEEAEPFMQEINASGELFVEAVEGLPDDLPDRLLDLAETIVDRGFSSSGQPSGNLVRTVRAAPDVAHGHR